MLDQLRLFLNYLYNKNYFRVSRDQSMLLVQAFTRHVHFNEKLVRFNGEGICPGPKRQSCDKLSRTRLFVTHLSFLIKHFCPEQAQESAVYEAAYLISKRRWAVQGPVHLNVHYAVKKKDKHYVEAQMFSPKPREEPGVFDIGAKMRNAFSDTIADPVIASSISGVMKDAAKNVLKDEEFRKEAADSLSGIIGEMWSKAMGSVPGLISRPFEMFGEFIRYVWNSAKEIVEKFYFWLLNQNAQKFLIALLALLVIGVALSSMAVSFTLVKTVSSLFTVFVEGSSEVGVMIHKFFCAVGLCEAQSIWATGASVLASAVAIAVAIFDSKLLSTTNLLCNILQKFPTLFEACENGFSSIMEYACTTFFGVHYLTSVESMEGFQKVLAEASALVNEPDISTLARFGTGKRKRRPPARAAGAEAPRKTSLGKAGA
jgi:hypothetical protein